MIEKTCIICNKKFYTNFRKTCSKKCENKSKGLNPWNKIDYEKEFGYLRPILKKYNENFYSIEETAKELNFKYRKLRYIINKLDCNYWTNTYEEHVHKKRLERNNYKLGTLKAMETIKRKYGVANPFQIEEVRIKALLNQKKTISNINKEFAKKLGIEFKKELVGKVFEKKVGKYVYDLNVGRYLIEINPTITHNSIMMVNDNWKPKEENYHLLKTLNAKENGYQCIHIFDWDNQDKIISLLKEKRKIYARNLDIKEVDYKLEKEFLNKYHLQNYVSSKIKLGLFKDDELLIMTFGKPRYNKNFEYELIRLCSKEGYFILGGANKLFNYFIKNYNPKSIISYCDISKFNGNVYEKLGFKENNSSGPRKHWYKVFNSEIELPKQPTLHITDNMLRAHGWSRLVGDNDYILAKKGESNEELILKTGYLSIFDCGQNRYEWYSNQK